MTRQPKDCAPRPAALGSGFRLHGKNHHSVESTTIWRRKKWRPAKEDEAVLRDMFAAAGTGRHERGGSRLGLEYMDWTSLRQEVSQEAEATLIDCLEVVDVVGAKHVVTLRWEVALRSWGWIGDLRIYLCYRPESPQFEKELECGG